MISYIFTYKGGLLLHFSVFVNYSYVPVNKSDQKSVRTGPDEYEVRWVTVHIVDAGMQ